MDLQEKLKILSGGARYDVSCCSSGSNRANSGGMGNTNIAGICHSWSADGRCVSLLKVLLTNHCIHDCAYCINRRSNDIERTSFTAAELVELTINFYRRNYIEGLFLSSGIIKNADYTMELMIAVARTLRTEHHFSGYIHLKAIPGASEILIKQAGFYADRMSVNLELPTEQSLKLLAPQKERSEIIKTMGSINTRLIENRADKTKLKNTPKFVPGGQSTQMIIGATPENDRQIIKTAETLYTSFSLKRVYYSGYVPINNDPRLPAPVSVTPTLTREHRLYQADWLLRYYNFRADEIVSEQDPFLDPLLDPKAVWALRNLKYFPLEINKAPYHLLLRVPGIGVLSAKRIIQARKFGKLGFTELKRLGVVLKRARLFITCQGKYYQKLIFQEFYLRQSLLQIEHKPKQLLLFAS